MKKLFILLSLIVLFPLIVMAEPVFKKGTTSQLLEIFISDSSSANGGGLTGLVYNSSGLSAYYYCSGTTATSVPLATMTVGTWSAPGGTSWGFKEIDATNMPGWYQFSIPDAALASGCGSDVNFHFKGAANMVPLPFAISLVDNLTSDVYTKVSPLTYTVANKIDSNVYTWNGTAVSTPDTAGMPKVTISSGTGAGQISLASGAVTVGTNNDKTGYTASTVSDKTGYSLTQSFPTNFSSLAITAGGAVTAGTVSDKTGYSLATPPPTTAQIATGVWQDATAGDFTTASSIGKSLYAGNVAPGGSGGLLISGSNAGTTTLGALTVTGTTTMSDGLVVNRSTVNQPAISATGNGTGAGALITGGASGNGVTAIGSSGTNDIVADINGNVSGSVGSVTGLTASNLDTTISSRLAPTVAGRTLDVATTGEAGVDFTNVLGTLDGNFGAGSIDSTVIAANAITEAQVSDSLENRLGWIATINLTGNTGFFVLSVNGEAISVANQFKGRTLTCGNESREIVASASGTPDTITTEPFNPWSSAPTSTTCVIR